MGQADITLAELAYVCRMYNSMTGFLDSYDRFLTRVNPELDLGDPRHREALLQWLNAWGCRNLACRYHHLASSGLDSWWRDAREELPPPADTLLGAAGGDLERFDSVFDNLVRFPAAYRHRNGHDSPVSFGATPASKTLFALRPQLFVPWDEEIRRRLGYDGSSASYAKFLKGARDHLLQISDQCSLLGIEFERLPDVLGRGGSTAAQLIGEYYWMTLTKRVTTPDAEILAKWVSWT